MRCSHSATLLHDCFQFRSGPVDDGGMARVLVVEHEPTIVTVVRYHLENAGFEGLYAGDVPEAWRLLVSEQPDIVVTDVALPGEDGWSLVGRMREDSRFRGQPAIVLGPVGISGATEKASSLGCDYLSKPFAATALVSKIRHLIALSHPNGVNSERERDGEILRVELVAIGVVLLLRDYRIEGKVYLAPELARFSDAWESVMRDQRSFVPVTDAAISTQRGDPIATTAFIEVRKSDVEAAYPLDVALE
jgi:CheY-like chemotaxis protein